MKVRYVNRTFWRRAAIAYGLTAMIALLGYEAASVFGDGWVPRSLRFHGVFFLVVWITSAAGIAFAGVLYPRSLVNAIGAATVIAAFSLAVAHPVGDKPPVAGYGLIDYVVIWVPGLGIVTLLTWLLTIPWRRVAPPDLPPPQEAFCAECGYPRRHLTTARCPECGGTSVNYGSAP